MLIKRTEGEREAYMEGYKAGCDKGRRMTDEIKEEIKNTIIQSNKDIDLACNEEQDINYRAWLGGNLEIVRILEKHYGKIIDDDEIIRESRKTITETSMNHLICAMCDNDKCVRGTKECEFEKWKKKQETGKYLLSIDTVSMKDMCGRRLFVGTGLTEQIVIETIREHLRTQPFGGLEIRVYEEVQKEEIE